MSNHWQEERDRDALQRERSLAAIDRRDRDQRERQALDDQRRKDENDSRENSRRNDEQRLQNERQNAASERQHQEQLKATNRNTLVTCIGAAAIAYAVVKSAPTPVVVVNQWESERGKRKRAERDSQWQQEQDERDSNKHKSHNERMFFKRRDEIIAAYKDVTRDEEKKEMDWCLCAIDGEFSGGLQWPPMHIPGEDNRYWYVMAEVNKLVTARKEIVAMGNLSDFYEKWDNETILPAPATPAAPLLRSK